MTPAAYLENYTQKLGNVKISHLGQNTLSFYYMNKTNS